MTFYIVYRICLYTLNAIRLNNYYMIYIKKNEVFVSKFKKKKKPSWNDVFDLKLLKKVEKR